jgi:predicted Rossmann fold nucleotide-binding protein DprA/Smf involved in DNA uptake
MITENTKAILLLTSFFNANEVKEYKTLTVNEYGYFACWLHQNGFKPVDLLNEETFDSIWVSWDEPLSHIKAKQIIDFARLDNTIEKLTYERIKSLLNRGASLSLALDKWQSAGVWIMDRQHEYYPKAIKKQLKHQSPALFFGVGNPELLSKRAIGFVGSRDCDTQDEQATNQYVSHFNQINYQVVSGAAKGVDSHAMLASLNSDNTAIGILADSLFKASASRQWRQHLKANNLVLISPFYPEGRFTPANAMGRNKFIYLLSSATVVVTSGEKGGTWEGAKENLKKGWVPLLVSEHRQPLQAGNQALINGVGLGKVLANACSISPDNTTEQLLGLFSTSEKVTSQQSNKLANESIKDVEKEHVSNTNDQGSLLSGLDISTTSASYTENPISNIQTQDDLFSMPENELENENENENEPEPETSTTPNKDLEIESVEVTSVEVESNEFEADKLKEPNTTSSSELQEQTKNEQVNLSNETQSEECDNTELLNVKPEQPAGDVQKTEQAPEQSPEQSTTPLLDSFYLQLCKLIEQQPQHLIDKTTLDSHFPEFEIMGKQALDKWLKHLVEQGKLIRPSTKKKQFTLPVTSST